MWKRAFTLKARSAGPRSPSTLLVAGFLATALAAAPVTAVPGAGHLAAVPGPAHLATVPGPAHLAAQTAPSAAAPDAVAPPRAVSQSEEEIDLPAGITRGPTVEGITEYRLDNGLRVLLFPDESRQQITVNVTYFVGSRHEAYGETGMAHLLEHLLFKGTEKYPDIPQELTERGARPNGTTWFDRTNYFETFPASEENLAWALDLEADRMVNSFVSAEDLESEMTVVRNEWEIGENFPFPVLMKRTMAATFQWHNYGKSTIGERSDIENVPIERLQAFYRKYYQPDNAMLVVAGRFEEETALRLISETFGALPAPERTGDMILWPTYTREPTQDGERSVTLRRVGDTQYAMAIYKAPAGPHEDYPAVQVLSRLLGDAPSGRLYRALVETGMAARAGGFGFQLREPGALIAFVEVPEDGDLEAARDELLRVVEAVAAEPPTEEEVERARNQFLRDIELTFRNTERIALQLSEWGANGDWRLFFLHRDRLESVEPEDVRLAAERYLIPSNRTVGLYIPVKERPARAEIPPVPDVEALVADYTGREGAVAGEAFDPTPGNVEARVVRSELPGGLKLALLPKRNRGETVSATLHLRFGTEESLRGTATAASLAGDMLMRGTERRTRQEFRDELDRLNARVFLSGGATLASARIETVRENLPAVLRLVGEALREPAFDEREWRLLKEERLAALAQQRSEPTGLGPRAFSRYMNPWPEDHPEYTPTFDEEEARIRAATLEEARAFWERLYGADGATMAVVGDFDAAEVETVVGELFAGWEAEQPYERFERPHFAVEATTIEIETPDKASAFLLAGLGLEMRDDHPDYAALVLGNYMLGGGFLNSRLAVRIRQEEGLSYGVGSNFSAHPVDARGSLTAFAIFAPENVDAVEAALREELEKVLAEGFTAHEVEAARRGYLESRQVNRSQDMGLAQTLSAGLFFGRTLSFDEELERRVAALTPDEVNEAVRRHLDLDALVVVRAGDFGAAAGEDAAPGEDAAAEGAPAGAAAEGRR